jgi:hypothetical protein
MHNSVAIAGGGTVEKAIILLVETITGKQFYEFAVTEGVMDSSKFFS